MNQEAESTTNLYYLDTIPESLNLTPATVQPNVPPVLTHFPVCFLNLAAQGIRTQQLAVIRLTIRYNERTQSHIREKRQWDRVWREPGMTQECCPAEAHRTRFTSSSVDCDSACEVQPTRKAH